MATKEERYDPGFNYDSEPEELNNRSEKNGSSPPSSPVDNVYLTGEFIYNDVWSGWRCGGPMADTDPEKKKEKESEASATKPDTKEEDSQGTSPASHGSQSETDGASAKPTKLKKCSNPNCPKKDRLTDHRWDGWRYGCSQPSKPRSEKDEAKYKAQHKFCWQCANLPKCPHCGSPALPEAQGRKPRPVD